MSDRKVDKELAAQRKRKLGRGNQRYWNKTSNEKRTERAVANDLMSHQFKRVVSEARVLRSESVTTTKEEQIRSEGPSPEKVSDMK